MVLRVTATPAALALIGPLAGQRFLTRSRLFDDTGSAWLDAHPVARVGI